MTAGNWCVVLGVSRGTGAAVARALARDPGLNVFGIHRGNHSEDAEAVQRAVEAAGRRCHLFVAEAGTAEATAKACEEVARVCGPGGVKLLLHSIANASVGRFVGDRQFQSWQFAKTFDAMAHSFVYWTQELLARDLLAPEARLLGLTNPLTTTPLTGCGLIAAAKSALETYVRYLAIELGPLGHRVNALNFGAAETTAARVALSGLEPLRPIIESATPAGRLVTLEEVARFVSVLAGDAGAWFNGAVIDFTGGEPLGYYDAAVRKVVDR